MARPARLRRWPGCQTPRPLEIRRRRADTEVLPRPPTTDAPTALRRCGGTAPRWSKARSSISTSPPPRSSRRSWLWLVGGGSAIGLGIAAMHSVGMLATQLPIGVTCEAGRNVVSVPVAVAASTFALGLAGGTTMGALRPADHDLHVAAAAARGHGARRFPTPHRAGRNSRASRSERSSAGSRSTWRTRTTQRSWPPITRAGFASPG